MSFARLLVRSVDVLTASTTTDRYGNTVVDWSAPASRTVRAWVSDRGSVEDLLGRDVTTTTAIVYLAAGDPITAADRVRLDDGNVYEVDGVPSRQWSPRGEHHVEVRLKDVEG